MEKRINAEMPSSVNIICGSILYTTIAQHLVLHKIVFLRIGRHVANALGNSFLTPNGEAFVQTIRDEGRYLSLQSLMQKAVMPLAEAMEILGFSKNEKDGYET